MFTTSFSGVILNKDTTYNSIDTTIVNRTQNKLLYDTQVSDGNFYSATIEQPTVDDILEIDIVGDSKSNKLYYKYDRTSTLIHDIELIDNLEALEIPVVKVGTNRYEFISEDSLIYNIYLRKDTVLATATAKWVHIDTITYLNNFKLKFLIAGKYRIDICKVVDNVSSIVLEKTINIVSNVATNNKQLLEWE